MAICANLDCAAAGVSWKFSESMWQSEHARPLPPRPASGIKQSYPEASAEQIHRLLAERMLGVELANKVYGHAR